MAVDRDNVLRTDVKGRAATVQLLGRGERWNLVGPTGRQRGTQRLTLELRDVHAIGEQRPDAAHRRL